MAQQHGLEWREEVFGLAPRWTIEPDTAVIEALCRRHLQIERDARCEVAFYAQGGFNKLYKIDTNERVAVMRIALPVDPKHKTASEVATIKFLRTKTKMPLPEIIAFDESNDNDLGLEWILMDFIPGCELRFAWRKMPMSKKELLVKQLAMYQSELLDQTFEQIGSIHGISEDGTAELGSMVAMYFFWGDRLGYQSPRGPFESSFPWLSARLNLVIEEQTHTLTKLDDEDEIEDAETSKLLAGQLLGILSEVFTQNEVELSVILHDDISLQNILVDEEGAIAAIVDWECVSALPLWRTCRAPHFLEGRVRNEEPLRDRYASDSPSDYERGLDRYSRAPLDNEGVNSLYWEHLMVWESSTLRKVFFSEMERLKPEWAQLRTRGELKNGFEEAVSNCDQPLRHRSVRLWLEAYRAGESFNMGASLVE
ncbi:hypothetical protein LTR37_018527 [Vermiconidia calcicola]|uniref:Uncharacterized protein n=1 Tax=Vermiconidia calcicola TaxID=1690605 RepID=A0ACC3MGW1_9PEZI|nr:hypothetical protein LTR37_018527 [Vermiconidia calcicola]